MWIEIAAFFLVASIILYCVLAGADFGAGMLELFLGERDREEQEEIVTRALGPVWEANHVWLVIAIVVLFVAFPKAYAAISIHLHIPLTAMLIGIILRGCAFTFRHYDAVKDRSKHWYSRVFVLSSFITPLTLGVLAGAIVEIYKDNPGADSDPSFYGQFVHPWCNWFCLSLGIFTCILFSFLASIYLLGELPDGKMRLRLKAQARALNFIAVFGGLLVFGAGEYDGLHLLKLFVAHPLSLASMVLATSLLAALWWAVVREKYQLARLFAAGQVALVITGWVALQAPNLYREHHQMVSIFNGGAEIATIRALDQALIAGSLLIFPALGYLLLTFKRN